MRRANLEDCSRDFLEQMAEAMTARIAAGETHNAEGADLLKLVARIEQLLPEAPPYHILHRGRYD